MRSMPGSPGPPVPFTRAGRPSRSSAHRRMTSWSVVDFAAPPIAHLGVRVRPPGGAAVRATCIPAGGSHGVCRARGAWAADGSAAEDDADAVQVREAYAAVHALR